MKEIIIRSEEAGQRLDKYLKKLLPAAGTGFLYKMLRKKNIDLNGAKSDGSTILAPGDHVRIFFSDETYEKMRGGVAEKCGQASSKMVPQHNCNTRNDRQDRTGRIEKSSLQLQAVLETDDVLFINKPAGMLSQGSEKGQTSVNDILRQQYGNNGSTYTPSVCNRLDRNTSGLLLAAKTYAGSRLVSDLIKTHSVRKKYLAIAEGEMAGEGILNGYLVKDHERNIVRIRNSGAERDAVGTGYKVLSKKDGYSLVEVELITGKSHQIRAHFASIGYPLAGDLKYGGHLYKGIKHQLLHSWKLVFPNCVPTCVNENNLHIYDEIYGKSDNGTILCQPGKLFLEYIDFTCS